MSYPAVEVVVEAYDLSGVVSADFATATKAQITRGMRLLNKLLSYQSINISFIPYHKPYVNNFSVDVQEYFIPNLVMCDTLTFMMNNVRWSMVPVGRKDYHGSARVQPLDSIPYEYTIEREKGGSRLFVYFFPDSAYPFEIWGKFGFDSVSNTTDMSLIYEDFYILYLQYALAELICNSSSTEIPPSLSNKLIEIKKALMDVGPIDTSRQKVSMLQNQCGVNWAVVNLSNGWL